MRKWLMAVLCCALLLTVCVTVHATESVDITESTRITVTGFKNPKLLTDGDLKNFRRSGKEASVLLESDQGMGGLYLLFDVEYGTYTVTDNSSGTAVTVGQEGYLHQFLDLAGLFGKAPVSVTVSFSKGTVSLSEVVVFSPGEPPAWVQRWQTPHENGVDILLFSTHGDDEQLYFSGLIPLYCAERELRVQVAYMTNHRNQSYERCHEMLDGLWAVGMENYPVFGPFPDLYMLELEGGYRLYEQEGVTREQITGYVTEQLRRFRPLVAVGHDVNGEYGHGMHRIYSQALRDAVAVSMDPEVFPESAEAFGVWDVPKTYLHLWEENPIVIDYDIPLERFDGLTAFQVNQILGFPCHESQHYGEYMDWLYGVDRDLTRAKDIQLYNPCLFGLYRSTVGEDILRNDFMENILSYDDQEALRLEQERLAAEQAAREEQQRLEAEKQAQQETEEVTREETVSVAAPAEPTPEERRFNQVMLLCSLILFLVAFRLSSALVKKFTDRSKPLRRK